MKLDDVITTVQGKAIKVEDVLVGLKVNGIFRTAVIDNIKKYVIDIKCQELGIKVSAHEVSEMMELKRKLLGLNDPEAFQRYLRANGVILEQWKNSVEFEVKADKLKNKIASDEVVVSYFEKNKEMFHRVSLGRIVCANEKKASEVMKKLKAKDSFSDIAVEYSIDRNTSFIGGYVGEVRRGMLPSKIDEAIFKAEEKDIVGPFEESGCSIIFKIFRSLPAELSETLKHCIREQIFSDWVNREVNLVAA